MFLLRPIGAVVHALFAKKADLVAENLFLSRGAAFNVAVHDSTSRGFVVGTRTELSFW